jgi:hypothetical protein
MPDQPSWVQGAPLLTIDYADTGQDEAELQETALASSSDSDVLESALRQAAIAATAEILASLRA